jgi:hypothetical protein
MMNALWLLLAAFTCLAGFAWLALAMSVHWQQVRTTPPEARPARTLRALGATALLVSLAACLKADHVGMAVLVWIMLLAAGANAVAMLLTWRPRWLRVLVPWTA